MHKVTALAHNSSWNIISEQNVLVKANIPVKAPRYKYLQSSRSGSTLVLSNIHEPPDRRCDVQTETQPDVKFFGPRVLIILLPTFSFLPPASVASR